MFILIIDFLFFDMEADFGSLIKRSFGSYEFKSDTQNGEIRQNLILQ